MKDIGDANYEVRCSVIPTTIYKKKAERYLNKYQRKGYILLTEGEENEVKVKTDSSIHFLVKCGAAIIYRDGKGSKMKFLGPDQESCISFKIKATRAITDQKGKPVFEIKTGQPQPTTLVTISGDPWPKLFEKLRMQKRKDRPKGNIIMNKLLIFEGNEKNLTWPYYKSKKSLFQFQLC